MRIITKTRLLEFARRHPDAEASLLAWHRIIRNGRYPHFASLRRTFPNADQVEGKYTVFNIGGNKYRLVAAIHYEGQRLYIRHILTHSEYDRKKWLE
ncbi:MAG: type II toxin-antitoxin system HigB family toxin [Nitrospinae bacterium]|nr:type II toxin-antitoxin system HigB family toxin [Nitrospinota bacterium]